MTDKEVTEHLRRADVIQKIVLGISLINLAVIMFFTLSALAGRSILIPGLKNDNVKSLLMDIKDSK